MDAGIMIVPEQYEKQERDLSFSPYTLEDNTYQTGFY